MLASLCRRLLHLPCSTWRLRASVRVNSAPQHRQYDLGALPDFTCRCRRRLPSVLNSRPLQPWSQQRGFSRLPDFARWCCRRLLSVLNSRPLQPWSQQRGFSRRSRILGSRSTTVWGCGCCGCGWWVAGAPGERASKPWRRAWLAWRVRRSAPRAFSSACAWRSRAAARSCSRRTTAASALSCAARRRRSCARA